MNAIEVRGLTKAYRDFTLNGLSFELPEGCILGLVGENGAGKTTTMRLLLGMTKPDGGEASVLGTEISADLTPVKEELGVVLDEPGIPWCMTAQQAGKMLAGLYKSWDAAAYDALLKKLTVPVNKPYQELSRGNRMKLGIAMALAQETDILFLDEPFGALDAQTRRTLQDELISIWKKTGKTILFVTHDIAEAVYLGEKISIFSVAPDASIVETLDVPYLYPRDINNTKIGDFVKLTTEKLEDAIRSSREAHRKAELERGLRIGGETENLNEKKAGETPGYDSVYTTSEKEQRRSIAV